MMMSDPTLTVPQYLLAAIIVVSAFFIRAIIGFGSGLIAVGLLVHLLPIRTTVTLVYLLDFAASIALGAYDFAHIRWRELRVLLPASLAGVAIGAYVLKVADPQAVMSVLGGFILLYVAYSVTVRPERLPKVSPAWALPLGLGGGVLSSLYGGGGPPLVAYLQMRRLAKRDFRATFQSLALVDAFFRGLFYLGLGILTVTVGRLALWFLPLVALGLILGNWVHFRVSERLFFYLALAVLTASGLRLVWP